MAFPHRFSLLLAGLLFCTAPAVAGQRADPAWQAETLAMIKQMVAMPTVEGRGQIAPMAASIRQRFIAAGFAAGDVIIDGSGDATTLAARYRGTGAGKPILLSGHMDVVEARASDWSRDPFAPVEEQGFLYGRGTSDMKFGNAVMISTMIKLKREGYRPARDIVLLLSGDEETAMATTARLAGKYAPGAELLLNADAGGGLLGSDGKPVAYMLQMAEKTYADFEISFTDPGGHSSRPGPSNAIYALARATDRIAAHRFPVQINDLTRAYFRATGKQIGGATGEAMLRLAEDPKDEAAAATLRADREFVRQIGTTCVATMVSGGHALNALPQKASLFVNCRIFPGVSIETVRAQLADIVDDPAAKVGIFLTAVASDASPARPDILRAVRKGVDTTYPGLPIVPQMSVGASDSAYFRAAGLPSYGVSGLFMRAEDDFSHGVNERIPVASIGPALLMWRTMLIDLAN